MPNLARLVQNRMAATVDLSRMGAEAIHIEYYLARITTEMVLEASALDNLATATPEAASAANDAMRRLPATLAQLLHAWDLTETAEDGSERALPLDEAHIEALGLVLQMAIWRTILSAQGEVSAAAAPVSAPASAAS